MSPEQDKALIDVPSSLKPTFQRAYDGGSKTAAIKAFCLACVGFERAGIRNCTAKACPLFPYRPYQQGAEE